MLLVFRGVSMRAGVLAVLLGGGCESERTDVIAQTGSLHSPAITSGSGAMDLPPGEGLAWTGPLQIGPVAPDPLQQVALITQSTSNTQAQLWIQEEDFDHVGNSGNNEAISIVMRNGTHFDTTTDPANSSGVDIVVSSTHSGSNSLACTAVRANAACDDGSSNYSFYSEHGVLRQFDMVSFGPGEVDLGNDVANFEVPGSATTNPRIGIGALPGINGTQLQTKNTVPNASTSGVQVGLDTSVTPGIRGGYLISRGPEGGFATNISAGVAMSGGIGFPFVASIENELNVFSEYGKSIVFGADSDGYTSAYRLTKANHLVVDQGTPHLSSECTDGGDANIVGTDIAMKVTTGRRSRSCTIVFAKSYTKPPICTVFPENGAPNPSCTITETAIDCSSNITATYNWSCYGQPGST